MIVIVGLPGVNLKGQMNLCHIDCHVPVILANTC